MDPGQRKEGDSDCLPSTLSLLVETLARGWPPPTIFSTGGNKSCPRLLIGNGLGRKELLQVGHSRG